MGTKLLLGFGSIVNQAVVHPVFRTLEKVYVSEVPQTKQ